MKFFVTGVNGQLGHDVMNELYKRGHQGVGSDIAPTYAGIADGSAVTTIRTNVDYIITDYGIARLTGRTFRDRAVSLINIAHPNFRPQLMEAYEKRFHSPFPVDTVE